MLFFFPPSLSKVSLFTPMPITKKPTITCTSLPPKCWSVRTIVKRKGRLQLPLPDAPSIKTSSLAVSQDRTLRLLLPLLDIRQRTLRTLVGISVRCITNTKGNSAVLDLVRARDSNDRPILSKNLQEDELFTYNHKRIQFIFFFFFSNLITPG